MAHDMGDRLFEAGCEDSLGSCSGGKCQIGFDRESSGLRDAVTSAVSQIEKCGLHVLAVVPDLDVTQYDQDELDEFALINLMLGARHYLHSDREVVRLLEIWYSLPKATLV